MQESHNIWDLPLLHRSNKNSLLENSIFKITFKYLSLLLASLKVEPLAKPKPSLNFFVHTAKPKTKVLAVLGQKLKTTVSTLSLSPGQDLS